MSKSTFDPTLFNFDFVFEVSDGEYKRWETNPQPDQSLIGNYILVLDVEDDWWTLNEIVYHNDISREVRIYCGRIPDDEWGFQLLKNMDIRLPVVQREILIDSLSN